MTVPADRRLIGGADIGAILGISPHATAADVWLRIVEGVGLEQNDVMQEGLLMEPGLFALIRARAPGTYVEHPTVFHPKFKHGTGHLDLIRTVPDLCVVDAKMVHWRARDRWEENGMTVVPDYVRTQVDWYMQCADAEKGEIGAFFGLGDFQLIPVEPLDSDTRGTILEAVERFWVDHVETKTPPPPDGSNAYAQILTRTFPDSGGVVALDGPMAFRVKEFLALKAQMKELEAKEEQLKQELEAWLKASNATTATHENLKIAWSKSERATPAWKNIVEQLNVPDSIIAANTKKTTFTTLRVTESKK